MASRPLAAVLRQLDQLGELLVDHRHQPAVLLRERLHEVGVLRLQLGRSVRIANLQGDRHSAAALLHFALFVALQRLVVGRLDRAEHVAEQHGAAALHLLDARRQLRGRDLPELGGEVSACARLLPVAALTEDLDGLSARRVRAGGRDVARRVAVVRTHRARLGAALLAHVRLRLTHARVARFDAAKGVSVKLSSLGRERMDEPFVLSAFQGLVARQSAAEVRLAAGNDLALLVSAVAVLGGEGHARGAGLRGVAVVGRRMVAAVRPRARPRALGPLRAARHRRVNHFGAALAVELGEGAAVARQTPALVADLITAKRGTG